MLRACYLLEDSINKIGRMGKSLSVNSDLDVLKNRLRYEYRNALVFFNELLSITNDSRVNEAFNDFIDEVNNVFEEEDFASIKVSLQDIPKNILGDYIKDLSAYDLSYVASKFQYDYSSTKTLKDEDLRNIGMSFNTETKRPINFLDAKCYNGYNSYQIKYYNLENINFYGMEEDTNSANQAKDRNIFTKIAKGGLNGAKCSNDAFDVAFLMPTVNYEADLTPLKTLRPRKEVEEFKRVSKYIRQNGLLILVTPYYRLTSQMCNLIAKNYKNISMQLSVTWSDFIILMGEKTLENTYEQEQEIYNQLRRISIASDFTARNELIKGLKEYTLPVDLLSIDTFRGSVLDKEDINDIINESNLYESFLNKQNNIIDDVNDQQPLLPFNIGQIGLVLTSGCLDGEIEEIDGQYHVIKGMVRKDKIVENVETDKKGVTETKTTYTNKVQINLITPDGTIKTLA